MYDSEFLYKNQDNSEFITWKATGESAVSLRGTARLSQIPHPTLVRWFSSDLVHKGVPKQLQPLAGQDLYLVHEIKVRGKGIKAIKSGIAAEIIKYAAFDLQKPKALEALKDFATIGLESYIQGVTGWLPADMYESTLEPRYRIQRLVMEPNPWVRLYSAEICDIIRSWYFPRDFFWTFAYHWMSADEIAFLDSINPVRKSTNQRKDRIHQHLSEETRKKIEPEIAKLCTLVECSTSKQDFETRWRRCHGKNQLELAIAL